MSGTIKAIKMIAFFGCISNFVYSLESAALMRLINLSFAGTIVIIQTVGALGKSFFILLIYSENI